MMPDMENNKERIPFEHYTALYQAADCAQIAARTQFPFLPDRGVLIATLMQSRYEVSYPDFSIRFLDGPGDFLSNYPAAQILLLRYLTGGRLTPGTGGYLSYRDIPWGEVYYANFSGRCLKRLAYSFSGKGEAVARKMAVLGGRPYSKGDIGWEFNFMPGLSIRFAIWEADDEFPPSAQILFSDNFPDAFSAEDIAFVGDIFIKILSEV